jgi:uncharacterized membrane protein YhhN
MKNYLLAAFVILSLIHLSAIAAQTTGLAMVTKPFLMPALAAWVYLAVAPSHLRAGWLLGLFCSTLGDILLIFEGFWFFIGGIVAFLLAHLAYIGAMQRGLPDKRGFLVRHPIWFLPFAIYPIALLAYLWPGIPAGMGVAVGIYALVISMMAQRVADMKGSIPDGVFRIMMGGAILFILSDSLIALSRFGHPFAGSALAIMLTYLLGQWLLAYGVVRAHDE